MAARKQGPSKRKATPKAPRKSTPRKTAARKSADTPSDVPYGLAHNGHPRCRQNLPGVTRCQLQEGHDGDHVGRVHSSEEVVKWESGSAEYSSADRDKTTRALLDLETPDSGL